MPGYDAEKGLDAASFWGVFGQFYIELTEDVGYTVLDIRRVKGRGKQFAADDGINQRSILVNQSLHSGLRVDFQQLIQSVIGHFVTSSG